MTPPPVRPSFPPPLVLTFHPCRPREIQRAPIKSAPTAAKPPSRTRLMNDYIRTGERKEMKQMKEMKEKGNGIDIVGILRRIRETRKLVAFGLNKVKGTRFHAPLYLVEVSIVGSSLKTCKTA